MDKRDLKAFLSGKVQKLQEGNFSSPGVGANTGMPAMWTGRQERLAQAWRGIEVKLEALFLDVLKSDELIYAQCLPLLKDIRGSRREACWENIPRFTALLNILKQAGQTSQTAPQEFSEYALHMEELCSDLQWMCDQLAPKNPRVPEKPPKDKASWQVDQMAKQGIPPPAYTYGPKEDQAFRESTQSNAKSFPVLPPSCPSLVMASLGRAADIVSESRDGAAYYASAGDAVRLCLENYTDISRALVDVGMAIPGSFPRLDVTCEWGSTTTVGKCSAYWIEDGARRGLVVEGKVQDFIPFDPNVTDSQVAARIYEALVETKDLSPRRVWTEARVVPALYGLLEKMQRGATVPMYEFDAVVATLATRLGLHESVRLTADQVKVHRLGESTATQFGYFWDWEQRYQEPFPFKDGELTNGEDDEKAPGGPKLADVKEGAYSETWESGRLTICVEKGKVLLVSSDGAEEEVPKNMKDEDVTARLLSIGRQKECHEALSEWTKSFKASLKEDFWSAMSTVECPNCGKKVDRQDLRGGVCRDCYNEINRPDSIPAKVKAGDKPGTVHEDTAKDTADKFAATSASWKDKLGSLIGRRFTDHEGEWELADINYSGVPYFKKVVKGKPQAKLFTVDGWDKNWAQKQVTEAGTVHEGVVKDRSELYDRVRDAVKDAWSKGPYNLSIDKEYRRLHTNMLAALRAKVGEQNVLDKDMTKFVTAQMADKFKTGMDEWDWWTDLLAKRMGVPERVNKCATPGCPKEPRGNMKYCASCYLSRQDQGLKAESSRPFEWEGMLREKLGPGLFEQEQWDPREHPRDSDSGEFVDKDGATPAQKKAAYRASKKMVKQAAKARKDRAALSPSIPPATPKGSMPQDVTPSGNKEVPAQEQPAEKEPERAPETPSGNKEPPQADTEVMPEVPETEPPALDLPKPEPHEMRPNPDLDAAFGFAPMPPGPHEIPYAPPPAAPQASIYPTEPKHAKVPEPPPAPGSVPEPADITMAAPGVQPPPSPEMPSKSSARANAPSVDSEYGPGQGEAPKLQEPGEQPPQAPTPAPPQLDVPLPITPKPSDQYTEQDWSDVIDHMANDAVELPPDVRQAATKEFNALRAKAGEEWKNAKNPQVFQALMKKHLEKWIGKQAAEVKKAREAAAEKADAAAQKAADEYAEKVKKYVGWFVSLLGSGWDEFADIMRGIESVAHSGPLGVIP